MAQPAVVSPDVRCTVAGSEFVLLPGTRTCINFGGYLSAEFYSNSYTNYPNSNNNYYTIGTLGITADTHSDTGGAPLKGFVDVKLQYRTADPWSDGPTEAVFNPQDIYFQWSGLTVGYRDSFFDFYGNANVQGTDPATIGASESLTLLAYTWTLPQKWSFTVSVEDSSERKAGVDPTDPNEPGSFGQRTEYPDLVAAVGQARDWGAFQVSGALHQVRATTPSRSDYTGRSDPETWGYALQAGVRIDLPQIANGDSIFLQTAYVDGAVSYLGLQDASGDFEAPDAFIRPDGGLSKVDGWNATVQFLHNWTPTLQSALFGGYGRFEINDAAARRGYGASGVSNANVGVNATWTPFSEASFTAQYIYNVYEANNFTNTGSGLPDRRQNAQQLLVMAQYAF